MLQAEEKRELKDPSIKIVLMEFLTYSCDIFRMSKAYIKKIKFRIRPAQ